MANNYRYDYDDEDDYDEFEPIERHTENINKPSYKRQKIDENASQLNETTIKYMIRDVVHEILHEYVTRDDLYKTIDRVLDERIGKQSAHNHSSYDDEEDEYDEADEADDQEALNESTMRVINDKKQKFNMDSDTSINDLFGGTKQSQALAKQPSTFNEAIDAIGGSSEDWVAEASLTSD